jgi:hypothetical protein
VIYAQTDSIFMHVPDTTAAQAIDVGKQTAKLVSAAFPKPMELKFENVSSPFMLLHVNRWVRAPAANAVLYGMLCMMPIPPQLTQASRDGVLPGMLVGLMKMPTMWRLGRGSWSSRDSNPCGGRRRR